MNAPTHVFTAFCCEADKVGTIWIDLVELKQEDIDKSLGPWQVTALLCRQAERKCAEDWGLEPDAVHCLGLIRGDVEVYHWEDLEND